MQDRVWLNGSLLIQFTLGRMALRRFRKPFAILSRGETRMSKFKMAAIAALYAVVALSASTRARPGGPSSAASAPDPKLIEDLVYANRILSDQGVVDAFGHVALATTRTRTDSFWRAAS